MSKPLVLAIDQGTSSTKCLLVDERGEVIARGQAPVSERHPAPGHVEQDAEEIWNSVRAAVAEGVSTEQARSVVAVAFSTQRESCVIWDRKSGAPLTPVLSWQDQRTSSLCTEMGAPDLLREVRARSGLPLDPMFSALKARWLLDRLDPGRVRAKSGEICVGTVDSWLLSRFGGAHLIEAGNASRTQLLDVRRASWDATLLELFRVPVACLPEVVASTGPFPAVRGLAPLPDGVPIRAVMADSHAALFGHGAVMPGEFKATHGTGSSVMGLIAEGTELDPGLCLTIAWSIDGVALAAEGNIRAAGATLRWAAGLLGVSTDELAALAADADNGGVSLVPAFNGLGAPWWDAKAVGLLTGLTLGSSRAQIARAALESIAHQVADVIEAVDRSGTSVSRLFVDGGPTRNDGLMQLEADLLDRPILRSRTAELSALGAAHLAGLAAGVWTNETLATLPREHETFASAMPDAARQRERALWRQAIARSRWPGPETPTAH